MGIITNNTHNAALLNRAHLIIFFLLLFVIRILRPKDNLFITNLINLGLVSPTQRTWRKKKEKDGIEVHITGFGSIATCNNYQRARGRDQHGPYSPCIDESRSSSFQNLLNIGRFDPIFYFLSITRCLLMIETFNLAEVKVI